MASSLPSRAYQILCNCLQLPFYFISSFGGYSHKKSPALAIDDHSASSLPALTGHPPESRFRLDNDASATFILPDGRTLGYAQYGAQNGRAILYQHGLPGSRIEGALFEDLCVKLGARIIAADRPGLGWSSPHPEGTLLSHAKDIQHLAEHLELREYCILALSGGGPYALACAASLPADKLKSVALVCGLGPPDIGMKGADWWHWLGLTIGYRYLPGLVRMWAKTLVESRLDLSDEKRLELVKQQFLKSKAHQKDFEVIDDDFLRLSLRGARESFAQGVDGFVQDGKLACSDFGFRVEDIRSDLPIQLWYGKLDTSVPSNHGEQIAVRLGGRAQLRVEEETHASLEVNYMERYLTDLLRSM